MVINTRKFAMRLSGLISEVGLGFSDIAKLSGVHAITISKYANNELKRTRPETYVNVNKLADALDVNPRWLAGEDGHPRIIPTPETKAPEQPAEPAPDVPAPPSWLKVGDPVYIEASFVGGGCYAGYSIYRGSTDPQNVFSELPNSLPIKNISLTPVI